MRPIFYLIGKKSHGWGGPTLGVVIHNDFMTLEEKDKMASSLNNGWVFFVQIMHWTEFCISSYHMAEVATAPMGLRQVVLELMATLGHIRDDKPLVMLCENNQKFCYSQMDMEEINGLFLKLNGTSETQEQMFKGKGENIYDDPNTLCSLWQREKLDIGEYELKQVEFRADPAYSYGLTRSENELWLKANVDWKILLEGVIK
ncbi:MAG: hypothetical protein GXZ11_04320 [Tissierellia bacterium]|nr:hypothetical protein [Tissierellia bacterium]